MYLPSYKINNSYTVYVNYVYLNECIKAGQKAANQKKQIQQVQKRVQQSLAPQMKPLANNTRIHHKKYGTGRVVSTDRYGIMKIAFDTKVLHFVYPDAVRKGILSVTSH